MENDNNSNIKTKQLLLKSLLRILKFFAYIGNALRFFFVTAIYKPFKGIAKFILKTLFVPMYKIYFAVKQWLKTIFSPAKNKILFPLVSKPAIHIIIIAIAIAVVVNNIGIRETKAEEFGQKTILASLVTDFEDIEIIEKAITTTTKNTSYYKTAGVLAVSDNPASGSGTLETRNNKLITTEGHPALVNPGLASTTAGNRPREGIIYYTVEGGDTVSTIAEKFDVTTNTLLWENELGPRDYIKPGDKLTILPFSGVSHQIKKGDTIEKIAKKYSVDANTVLEYNLLADASAIEIDQIILVPGGEEPAPPAPKPSSSSSRYALFDVPPSAALSGANLQWPTSGQKISQYYRWGHLAIDISGDYSSPVYASDNGRVELAGSNQRGYGLQVVINHGNGIKTRYAHESKIFVKVGDSVTRGQTIGMIGCTGWCSGPHVHYEVIVNGKKVNPLHYL